MSKKSQKLDRLMFHVHQMDIKTRYVQKFAKNGQVDVSCSPNGHKNWICPKNRKKWTG
jgi:hypothetical protein